MQRADFFCDGCNVTIEVEYSLKEGPPKQVPCPGCEKPMKRLFGSTAVHIPEWFGDHNHNAISKRMENAPRPTGRDKTLY
jgi:hypothetical protein